jgi:hypothetical protein
MSKKAILLAVLAFLPTTSFAGQLSLGGKFVGWSSNYLQPFNGYEIWAPLSFNFKLKGGLGFYGQTEYGMGHYTDSLGGTANTIKLNALSDSVLGGEINFESFNVPSILNIGFNIPTGDPTWESKQVASSIPTQFINSRYQGRGFGVSALYGLSFPAGGAEIGAAAGYLYSGAFNPSASAASGNLKLGDSIFLSFNHVQPFSGNQSQIIRLSGFYFLPTQEGGQNVFQMGPNINASYSWSNPKALSLEVGGQYYLSAQRMIGGQFAAEPKASFGPRFYVVPSYAFWDLAVAGRVKYILANSYATTETFYNGGGLLYGIEPSYRLKLGSDSALHFSAGYDGIIAMNAGIDIDGAKTNVLYTNWTAGVTYEVKL